MRAVPARNTPSDFAETAVLPEHLRPDRVDALKSAAAESERHYREYVRFLDELPMLVDVVQEPPRAAVRDFRLGQRPDARKAQRADAALLREHHVRDLETFYAEYVELGGLTAANRAAPCKAPRKSGTQKKRAKRAKRSARSRA
jgi:hypothetical protein